MQAFRKCDECTALFPLRFREYLLSDWLGMVGYLAPETTLCPQEWLWRCVKSNTVFAGSAWLVEDGFLFDYDCLSLILGGIQLF